MICGEMLNFITFSSQKGANQAENSCFSGKVPPFLRICLKLVLIYSIIIRIIKSCNYAVNSIKCKE